MPRVDDTWADYWASVESETRKIGSSVTDYQDEDHEHVVGWFRRHWDLLEPMVDDPEYSTIRFATFDGEAWPSGSG